MPPTRRADILKAWVHKVAPIDVLIVRVDEVAPNATGLQVEAPTTATADVLNILFLDMKIIFRAAMAVAMRTEPQGINVDVQESVS